MKKIEIMVILVLSSVLLIFLFQIRIKKQDQPQEYYFSLETPEELTIGQYSDNNLSAIKLLDFRGIDFFPWPDNYDSGIAFNSLENLLRIQEINYVQLRFFLRQISLDSNEITYYDDNQDYILTFLIKKIHQAGKKVSLMPHLYVDNGGYVANLKPQDKDLWFKYYSQILVHFAQLAEMNNVELFSIGNEMTSIFTQNDSKWERIIDSIKENYHGHLTVKLNCWYTETQFNDLLRMKWLYKLDYIGIAAYFDLTNKMNPTEEDLENAWFGSRQGLNIINELTILSDFFQKPLIISEIGYRNVDGCNIEPWNALDPPRSNYVLVTGLQDDAEALLCTKVFFETFMKEKWFQGAFWFYWPTREANETDTGFSIWEKPILKEILKYYSQERN